MTSKTKDAIRSALFEAAFVVLGVVLALAANEWRQARADKHQSEQALATIFEELKTNRTAMSAALEYHSGLLDTLGGQHEEGWKPGLRVFRGGFIAPAKTSRTAWETASETGAFPKTDFTIVKELSNVYAQQDRYEDQARKVGEIIYGELFRGGAKSVADNYRNLASIIATFKYREMEMLAEYDEAIASLESRGLAGPAE
jgi:hypothetical protein